MKPSDNREFPKPLFKNQLLMVGWDEKGLPKDEGVREEKVSQNILLRSN